MPTLSFETRIFFYQGLGQRFWVIMILIHSVFAHFSWWKMIFVVTMTMTMIRGYYWAVNWGDNQNHTKLFLGLKNGDVDDNDTTAKWIGVIITPIQRLPAPPLWSSTRVIQSDKSTSFIHTPIFKYFSYPHTCVQDNNMCDTRDHYRSVYSITRRALVSRNLIAIKSELLSPVHPAPATSMLPQCFQNATN